MISADHVDVYIEKAGQWQPHLEKLRGLALAAGFTETIKWGGPSYEMNGKLVLGIGAFKHWACIWFHQGVYLKDPLGVLVSGSPDKTKAMRQWRFTSFEAIHAQPILEYMLEAQGNANLKVKPDRNKPIIIPLELEQALQDDSTLSEAFYALSKSNQRDYCAYITEAKRDATKAMRLEKIGPMIISGIGLHDKYK